MRLATIVRRARSSETFSDQNLVRLGVISFVLSLIDTVQSFYLQKVVNVYGELSPIAELFFRLGAMGFIVYVPVAFLGAYLTFIVLWGCASYVIWYYSTVLRGDTLKV